MSERMRGKSNTDYAKKLKERKKNEMTLKSNSIFLLTY